MTNTLDLSQHDDFLDRLLRVPQLYSARISPDGQWVAWIWAGLAETTQLWLAASGGARVHVACAVRRRVRLLPPARAARREREREQRPHAPHFVENFTTMTCL